MLYSAREFQTWVNDQDDYDASIYRGHINYGRIMSLHKCRNFLRQVKYNICHRQENGLATPLRGLPVPGLQHSLNKFIRPWEVVPALKNFQVPVGDFGVGVEVEHGFNTAQDATFIANKVKNWRNICIDSEGGLNGLEVTFPPVLLSKLDSNSKCFRYVRLLKANPDRLYTHDQRSGVGTHINVSKGGHSRYYEYDLLVSHLYRLSKAQKLRYFGRPHPWGYIYSQRTYYEFKMFNSVPDVKAMRRYINIAVALTKLMTDRPQNYSFKVVKQTLEAAYRQR